MPGIVYLIWSLTALLELSVGVCALMRQTFRRYIFLNLYMVFAAMADVGRYEVLKQFGFASSQYRYVYYYSDAVLTILLYLALINLYIHVFDEMKAEKFVRLTAVILLAGTAAFSYAVVLQSSHRIPTRFVFELSQNLYFVGLVLTYVLWGAMLKLRETRVQLIQLVLSLGIYFSAYAATYAARNMLVNNQSWFPYVTQVAGCLLPMAWTYAFLRLPPDARMTPARLAVVPR